MKDIIQTQQQHGEVRGWRIELPYSRWCRCSLSSIFHMFQLKTEQVFSLAPVEIPTLCTHKAQCNRHQSITLPPGTVSLPTQNVIVAQEVILPGKKVFLWYLSLQKSGGKTPSSQLHGFACRQDGGRAMAQGDAGCQHQPPLRWPSSTSSFLLSHRDSR